MTHSKWLGTSWFARFEMTPGGGGRAGTFLSCSQRAGLMFTIAGSFSGACLLTLTLPTLTHVRRIDVSHCQTPSVNHPKSREVRMWGYEAFKKQRFGEDRHKLSWNLAGWLRYSGRWHASKWSSMLSNFDLVDANCNCHAVWHVFGWRCW